MSLWEDGKKVTTVHDRYQVCDECCGQVETETSLKRALELAERHAKKHAAESDSTVKSITVFDRMARRDCQDTWEVAVPHA